MHTRLSTYLLLLGRKELALGLGIGIDEALNVNGWGEWVRRGWGAVDEWGRWVWTRRGEVGWMM